MKQTSYEWDVETLDITDPDDPQVLDHDHSDTLPGLFFRGALSIGSDRALVLVRTQENGRSTFREWAYVTEAGGLPTHFRDAHENEGSKVPQAFRREWERNKDKITFTGKPTEE